ncbi:MAG: BolA family transcriptional regulator [Gammaproteobacteria bacterium]|nr:BolA family transcriptional regulator [Gammaproteobacteria bacterium]
MNAGERRTAIHERISNQLQPLDIIVEDESHLHAGHPGARDGRGHFRVRVVSDRFAGLNTLQRHRLVYAAVGELMQSDIHALSVTALTSLEAGQQQQA